MLTDGFSPNMLQKGFTVHDLRRSFGSYLLDLGYNIAEVSSLMGHSAVKVTEEHYIGQLDYKKREIGSYKDYLV